MLDEQLWEKIVLIPGWTTYEAASMTQQIVQTQRKLGCDGAFLELGVYKGRYLSLLYNLCTGTCVGVDGLFASVNKPLEEQWIEPAKQEMISAVASITPDTSRLKIVHANTHNLDPAGLREHTQADVQFASIDAGHEADDVFNDMAIVCPLLALAGVIAMDDVFNPVVPGVTEGFVRFMIENPGFKSFAYIGNKAFVCRSSEHRRFYESALEFMRNEPSSLYDWTRAHFTGNQNIGFSPKMFGVDMISFLRSG
jgi:hypothetical protein